MDTLNSALRQYRHNDSDEFVFGYDKEVIDELLKTHTIVPNEPTEAMCKTVEDDVLSYACVDETVYCDDCGSGVDCCADGNIDSYMAEIVYKTMLKAAQENS